MFLIKLKAMVLVLLYFVIGFFIIDYGARKYGKRYNFDTVIILFLAAYWPVVVIIFMCIRLEKYIRGKDVFIKYWGK